MKQTAKVNSKKYIIAAYYSDNKTMKELSREDLFKLTHINYSFAIIKNGKVNGKHLKNLAEFRKIVTINPELKTIISIGGWGAGGFSEAASTTESRTKFVDSAIEFMKDNEFDGIDIDWEYPCSSLAGIASDSNDKHNFTLVLKELRAKLDILGKEDNKHYLLTIATGAGQKDNLELDLIIDYLDFINIMTYDMRGSFQKITGHHTNLYSSAEEPEGISGDKAVQILINVGVPADKIVLGAAFYARAWSGVKNINNGLYQKAETTGSTTYDYTQLLTSYINKNGFTRYFDDIAKAPYLFNGDIFISYDDEESLKYKANYIKSKGLKGIMYWEYPLDNSHVLLDRLFKELN